MDTFSCIPVYFLLFQQATRFVLHCCIRVMYRRQTPSIGRTCRTMMLLYCFAVHELSMAGEAFRRMSFKYSRGGTVGIGHLSLNK